MAHTRSDEMDEWNKAFLNDIDPAEAQIVNVRQKPLKRYVNHSLFHYTLSEQDKTIIESFLNKLKSKLTEAQLTDEILEMFIQHFRITLHQKEIAPHIQKLDKIINSKDLMNNMTRQLTQSLSPDKKNTRTYLSGEKIKSILSLMMKSIAANLMLGTVCSMASLIEAQRIIWTQHSGNPTTDSDHCSGKWMGCISFYLTPGNNLWSNLYPVGNRLVEKVNKKASFTDYQQLSHCVSESKVMEALIKALESAGNGVMELCAAAGTAWNGWGVTSDVMMPTDSCPFYKNNFAALVNNCKSWSGSAGELMKDIGIGVAGIAALLFIVCIGCYAYEACNRIEYDNLDDDKEAARMNGSDEHDHLDDDKEAARMNGSDEHAPLLLNMSRRSSSES